MCVTKNSNLLFVVQYKLIAFFFPFFLVDSFSWVRHHYPHLCYSRTGQQLGRPLSNHVHLTAMLIHHVQQLVFVSFPLLLPSPYVHAPRARVHDAHVSPYVRAQLPLPPGGHALRVPVVERLALQQHHLWAVQEILVLASMEQMRKDHCFRLHHLDDDVFV